MYVAPNRRLILTELQALCLAGTAVITSYRILLIQFNAVHISTVQLRSLIHFPVNNKYCASCGQSSWL
jgi:hypothetical protein